MNCSIRGRFEQCSRMLDFLQIFNAFQLIFFSFFMVFEIWSKIVKSQKIYKKLFFYNFRKTIILWFISRKFPFFMGFVLQCRCCGLRP